MAFDGIVLNSVVHELQQNIIGSKVNKVYQPTKNNVILDLYSMGKKFNLNLCIEPKNCRLNLTNHSMENPMQAPSFCMLLRKHLTSSKLININTFDLERIVELEFETFDEFDDVITKKIIIEIMAGHSNIILVNSSNKIIDSLRHVVATREILPGKTYAVPENNKNSFLLLNDFNDFCSILQYDGSSIDKLMSDKFIGISQSFIRHAIQDIELPINNLPNDDLEKLYNYTKEVINSIEKNSIKLVNDENDFYITIATSNNSEELSLNNFIDDWYYKKESNENLTNTKKSLLNTISVLLKKFAKRLENIDSKLNECKNMDTYRLYGELITSNLYKYNNMNLDNIKVENYYDNNSLIDIPLDKSINVNKNATRYFKKYNKLKNAFSIVSVQKKETELELKYIESIIYSIENSNTLSELEDIIAELHESNILKNKKKIKTSKRTKKDNSIIEPLKYIIDGFTILAGKNNKQNDILSLKIANNSDIWFHVKDVQGSHVILKTENKQVDYSTLEKCAKIAVENSKAKYSSNVAVDYCEVKYVKKPSGAKPGMVIYTNYKTIFV